MQEHMSAEADMAILPMVILITLLRQLPEGIIAEVSLGILSARDALTAHALEATHGMDQNVRRLPPQATPEAVAIIIIPPI